MTKLNLMAGTALMAVSLLAGGNAYAAADTTDFISKAAIAGKFEVESSKLALQKSADPEVKTFAQKMIADHEAAAAGLKAAAAADGYGAEKVPTALDEAHINKLTKLKGLKDGKEFDTEYTDVQHKAHEEAVSLFRDYGQDGDKPNLKAFAQQTLATLKTHEDHAEALDKKY